MTEKNDLDKLDSYVKSLLHLLVNKPIDTNEMIVDVSKKDSKKKAKKTKKH
jgi:hypothetical protein